MCDDKHTLILTHILLCLCVCLCAQACVFLSDMMPCDILRPPWSNHQRVAPVIDPGIKSVAAQITHTAAPDVHDTTLSHFLLFFSSWPKYLKSVLGCRYCSCKTRGTPKIARLHRGCRYILRIITERVSWGDMVTHFIQHLHPLKSKSKET